MLEFFLILTKGGVKLWCSPDTIDIFRVSINTFLKSLILKENAGFSPFVHNSRAIKMHMDNEFNLLYIAAYQHILQLTYVDKFLTDIALEFRDRYKNLLQVDNVMCCFQDFQSVYLEVLNRVELEDRRVRTGSKQMRTFDESQKSKKTVASMIVSRNKKPLEQQNSDKSTSLKGSITSAAADSHPSNETNGKQRNGLLFAENQRKLPERLKLSKRQKDPPGFC
ncbi:unnamed protein product [Dicrocoelium dendriticum]|nr:unnamed protein product [Dicrocoelium dendriticum]